MIKTIKEVIFKIHELITQLNPYMQTQDPSKGMLWWFDERWCLIICQVFIPSFAKYPSVLYTAITCIAPFPIVITLYLHVYLILQYLWKIYKVMYAKLAEPYTIILKLPHKRNFFHHDIARLWDVTKENNSVMKNKHVHDSKMCYRLT